MDPITDFCAGAWSFIPDSLRTRKDIPASAKVVYTALTHRARIGRGKDYAFPSMQCLAKDTGQDTRTCQRAVQLLAELGYLAVEHRKRDNGSGKSNCYHLAPLYISDRGGDGKSDTPPMGNLSPLEVEKGEAEKTTYAATPRGEVSEKPTATEPPRELVIVPCEDEVPYNSLARQKKPPSPKYLALGKKARELWEGLLVPAGAGPPMATWSVPTLVKAGKTIVGLKDTPFADKSLQQVFTLLGGRIKTCKPIVRNVICFGWLFCAPDNLARLLAGDWDTGEREEVGPKKRIIPIDKVWPGMGPKDEAAYWAKVDGAQEKEEG